MLRRADRGQRSRGRDPRRGELDLLECDRRLGLAAEAEALADCRRRVAQLRRGRLLVGVAPAPVLASTSLGGAGVGYQ
ncbi:MAG TPA: hypothetical protein VK326_05305 [Solirubrobacterales bacterium]|nr:hypothetical protein [Solirubrobacterales bacterium]